ncbi:MAG: gluconolaconase [Cyanobacteria bacterium RYN_339]|nr:gluconolaconase [Cyanobacteria bacterium RYN_339]
MTRWPIALALLALGCTPPVAPPPTPKATPSVVPALPPAAAGVSTFEATAGGATRRGVVALRAIADAAFGEQAAPFRLLDLPAAHAVVTAQTADGRLFAVNGQVVAATTDAAGRFTFPGTAPGDRPFLVQAALARNHRLLAYAPPGAGAIAVDEASTMVAVLAATAVDAAKADATTMQALYDASGPFLALADFEPDAATHDVQALKTGAAGLLRGLYVRSFGRAVHAGGDDPADRLSDRWRTLLDRRPLALTGVAGGGQALASADDVAAPNEHLRQLADAVADANGDVYLATGGTIRLVPAADRGGLGAWAGPMRAGRIYTVAGSLEALVFDFDTRYVPLEPAVLADPAAAPVADAAFPLVPPTKLALLPSGVAGKPHLLFTCAGAQRLFLIPGTDVSRWGRRFLAGRLYTLAGTGSVSRAELRAPQAGQPAWTQPFFVMGALARDEQGNAYLAEQGLPPPPPGVTAELPPAALYVVAAADGRLLRLPLAKGGQPYTPGKVVALAYHLEAGQPWLYALEADKQAIFRVAVPKDFAAGATLEVQPVTGLTLANPTGLAFDGVGDLVVADAGKHALLVLGPDGRTSSLGGADQAEGEGGSAAFPRPVSVATDLGGNILVADQGFTSVRRLWTARGCF